MHRLIQGIFEHPTDEGVLIYCDQDKDEALVMALSNWHRDFIRADKNAMLRGDHERKIVTSYGSNINFLPLQAADVVAHEIMRRARAAPSDQHIIRSESWILKRLSKAMPFLVMNFTKQLLEMELDGRAFVPGQWPGYRFVPPPAGWD